MSSQTLTQLHLCLHVPRSDPQPGDVISTWHLLASASNFSHQALSTFYPHLLNAAGKTQDTSLTHVHLILSTLYSSVATLFKNICLFVISLLPFTALMFSKGSLLLSSLPYLTFTLQCSEKNHQETPNAKSNSVITSLPYLMLPLLHFWSIFCFLFLASFSSSFLKYWGWDFIWGWFSSPWALSSIPVILIPSKLIAQTSFLSSSSRIPSAYCTSPPE